MAYLAFIWGTRTFLYWTYKPMQPTLWDAMGTLRNELATLDRTLSSANCRWVRAGTSGTRVHYTMWQGDGRAYVIACNASSEPVFVTFDVMPLVLRGAARPWHDEVRSQVAGDKLNAWFGPYGREVFEMRAAS